MSSVDEAVEKLEYLGIAGGNSHSCGTAMLGKELDFFFFRTLDMRLPYDLVIVSKIHSRESKRHDFAKRYVTTDFLILIVNLTRLGGENFN